jgi:hypothetical protein
VRLKEEATCSHRAVRKTPLQVVMAEQRLKVRQHASLLGEQQHPQKELSTTAMLCSERNVEQTGAGTE